MSDAPGGPDWEQGSDRKWYAPGVLSGAGWQRAADGLWYQPQAGPGMQPPGMQYMQQPPKKKSHGCLIAALVVIALFLIIGVIGAIAGSNSDTDTAGGGGGGGGSSSSNDAGDDGPQSDFSTNTENPPAADIDDITCSEDFGLITGVVNVTNNSSGTSNYIITIGIEQNGVKIGEGFGSLDNVDPGQTARVEIIATGDTQGQAFQCTVDEVERFAS